MLPHGVSEAREVPGGYTGDQAQRPAPAFWGHDGDATDFALGMRPNSLVTVTRRCNRARVPDNHFGEDVAARYDEGSGPEFDPEVIRSTVDVLAELVGDGTALEFAVGTGRIALPLAARGVPVSGIELSEAMAERLRSKDGADRVEVTIGDMATTRVGRSFRLVYLVFNTIGNLTTQDQQVACFANAAAHLEAGGFFVIEVTVPDLRRLPPGEDARVFAHAAGYVGYDRYVDLVAQQAVSHHFVADGSGAREFQTPFRYAWPSELDLMAQLAGMSLRHRWAAWDRSPFNGESTSHVSVWEKQDDTSSRVS
jgi:SAM-dependent methyltransferase